MTRLGHGGLKLARDWVAPGDIVGSALNRLRAVLAPYRVQAIVANDLPLLYVHAALIEQALINVLENAARFSPSHGRLRIEVSQDAAELRFAVSDEGPGIPRPSGRRSSTCSTPLPVATAVARAPAWAWRSARA